MKNQILCKLVLPLSFLAIIPLVFYFDAESFYLNISTELLSIVITISYVSWVINNLESKKWKMVETRVFSRLQHLVNESVALINFTFFDESLKDKYELESGFVNKNGENIYIKFLDEVELIGIESKIYNIDGEKLNRIIRQYGRLNTQVIKISSDYGEKMPAELFAYVSDIKDLLFHTIDSHIFQTETHNINSETLLHLIREGTDPIHNTNYLKFLADNSRRFLHILKRIDAYLALHHTDRKEVWPYMVRYENDVER